jgi:hypothetical protein
VSSAMLHRPDRCCGGWKLRLVTLKSRADHTDRI